MLKVIEAYLALRRATGFAMLAAEYLLKSFAAFAAERGAITCRDENGNRLGRAWTVGLGQRDARLRAVCRFVRHVQMEDIGHELPPAHYFGARKRARRRTARHIYTAGEISRLIEAGQLRPMRGMHPLTQATLIALLSATGLRISEALKLTIADVTHDGLLVRETKFRKTRLVPLHETAAIGLRRYLDHRGPGSIDDPVFIDTRGRPLRYIAVKETFDVLVGKAGIKSRSGHSTSLARFAAHVCRAGATRQPYRPGTGVERTWWRSRPTWVTSTSTPPTGIWRPRPTFCARSLQPAKRSYPRCQHDADCSPHRDVPPRHSRAAARRQPTHQRLLCPELPIVAAFMYQLPPQV